jgi:hypothetical protein
MGQCAWQQMFQNPTLSTKKDLAHRMHRQRGEIQVSWAAFPSAVYKLLRLRLRLFHYDISPARPCRPGLTG